MDNLYWGEGSEPDSPTPYVSPTTITPTRPGAPPSPPRGGVGRRDPARVVKFSPAGAGRELLVFSEVSGRARNCAVDSFPYSYNPDVGDRSHPHRRCTYL